MGATQRFRWDPDFKPFVGHFTQTDLDSLVTYVREIEFPHIVQGVYSQLRPKEWLTMLVSGSGVDPDIHYVLDGVTHGFKVVNNNAPITGYCCTNYRSCVTGDNKEKLDILLSNEIEMGKLTKVSEKPTCIHAMGVVKKKDSSKIRPITDCRRPIDVSVKNFADEVLDEFKFVTLDEIICKIVEGKNFLSTVDLASAYRAVLIHPDNRQYFGLMKGDDILVDNFLCFGCKAAPFIFNRITDSVCRYLRDIGVECYNYLDDIVCLTDSYEQGVQHQLFIIRLLRKLGFYIAWQKVSSPSCKCVYLGVELNTEDMYMRLPDQKIDKLRKELKLWRHRRKATRKQLEVLVGLLSHASRVIKGGKLYMHFLLEKLSESRDKKRVKLRGDFHEDLSWWNVFVERENFSPLCNVYDTLSWLSLFSKIGSVRVSTWDFECEVTVHDYTIDSKGFKLFAPQELISDAVAIEICVLWIYCMENADLAGCSLILFCNRKALWLALKKKRYKTVWVNLVLRHIFWWTMYHSVNWIFEYKPIDHVNFRHIEGSTW